MALKISTTSPHGSTHANAYHRIRSAEFDYKNNAVRVVMAVYPTAAAAAVVDNTPWLEEHRIDAVKTVTEAGTIPAFADVFGAKTQAAGKDERGAIYDALNLLDRYDGATDA